MKRYTILYVGPLTRGGTCRQRMEALQELGHSVIPIDTMPQRAEKISSMFAYCVYRKLLGPLDLSGANRRMIESARRYSPDIVWIDKGLTISLETLKQLRAIPSLPFILSYSPDDMMNPGNQSRHYLDCLPEYDLHVTTKSYNVKELQDAGAKTVLMVGNAFSPSVHYPTTSTPQERERYGGPIGFIGFPEKDRERSLNYLAENGIRVRIWGPWKKDSAYHHNLIVEGKPLWADDYRKAICSFDINLCFLRKINRDLQTTRSVEIPACGGFMLAERSNEHLQLFEEGKEAEFFASDEELLDKARYYLSREYLRRRIGAAGRECCLRSGYSYHDRLKQILSHVDGLNKRCATPP